MSDFNLIQICGAILVFVGVILHIIGLATPNWTTATMKYNNPLTSIHASADVSVGLWMNCYQGDCSAIKSYNLSGAWRAAGGFAILGMLCGFLTLAVALVHVGMPFCKKLQFEAMSLVIMAASIVTLLLIIISVSCYGGGAHKSFSWPQKDIGYSLILSIIGGIIISAGGAVFYFPGARKTT